MSRFIEHLAGTKLTPVVHDDGYLRDLIVVEAREREQLYIVKSSREREREASHEPRAMQSGRLLILMLLLERDGDGWRGALGLSWHCSTSLLLLCSINREERVRATIIST